MARPDEVCCVAGCGTASEGLDDPGTELLPIVRYFAERNKVRAPLTTTQPAHLFAGSTGPALPGSEPLCGCCLANPGCVAGQIFHIHFRNSERSTHSLPLSSSEKSSLSLVSAAVPLLLLSPWRSSRLRGGLAGRGRCRHVRARRHTLRTAPCLRQALVPSDLSGSPGCFLWTSSVPLSPYHLDVPCLLIC